MSFQRRAAAPRLIEWTGERCVPWAPDVPVVYEHFHRYLWAARLVDDRWVLDLGSGEGFGAALLASSASHVVGLDIDELAVEHSQLNYAGANLEFKLGTALDLSEFGDASFDAVVAFEIIEHVREQETVLAEVARVLRDDGILIMSTPDRRMYGESRSEPNPFHEDELSIEEFHELLGRHFSHLALWGQRTITGSHIGALEHLASAGKAEASEFFIERAGEEWRLASTPAALYCISLASKTPLPAAPVASTLADCGLELMRVKERDTLTAIHDKYLLSERLLNERRELSERLEGDSQRLASERQQLTEALERERADGARALRERDLRLRKELAGAAEDVAQINESLLRSERTILELRAQLASTEGQLASAAKANQRAVESVSWQAFQRARGRLYHAIGGERSLRARTLGATLRLLGRLFMTQSLASPLSPPGDATSKVPELIQLPQYDSPQVSLIIPVHAHAELTGACLRSIRDRTSRVTYEVILVDDLADDDTQSLLDTVRGAKIVRNETNLGFLRSMNRGAAAARGQWLVLFNNDTEVTQGWLASMLDCATSAEDVGVVTPKFIYPDGSLNEAGAIVWRDGTAANYGRGDAPDRFQYEYRRETDYGSAAALMVSAQLWSETGGFDERYRPIYYEDADLCFEARERGLRVLYEPRAVVVHIEGATSGTDPSSGAKRYQEQNRRKFVAKWRGRLETEHRYPAPTNLRAAANRHRGEQVLVIDHRVPMWDRDAGSLRMMSMMQALIALGARVTFMPDNLASTQPYTLGLQSMGIEVLYGHIDVKAEMAIIGPELSTAIVCRPHTASRWLDTVREFAPKARVVYDTVDLHWLREARKDATSARTDSFIASNGNLDPAVMWPKAKALRELELAMIRATDTTLVVSERERVQVEKDVPGTEVLIVPTVHDVEPYVPPFEGRAGILFVGGFEHVPNVDAAIRLVKEVMPSVWSEIGDVRVTIAGPSAPAEVQALMSPLVDVVGWVEDLSPLFEQSRLLVAPLRFGAGMKGKITHSLAVGLPVVTTSIGAEGIVDSGLDGNSAREECLLIADDLRELASQTIRLYQDHELWQRKSQAGQALITERCSTELVTARLSKLLGKTEAAADVALVAVGPGPAPQASAV
jgi:GT2 family glycosyltransferase/SAM-dependent methyltransferase/glycosyltransferase involved in cell wall biosynthesis